MIQIAGLILILFFMLKRVRVVRAGGVDSDQELEGTGHEQQGNFSDGRNKEINRPWDPQVSVRKTYPSKLTVLFIYPLPMISLSRKEFFSGQFSPMTEWRMLNG